eukprot:COSAG01_NODE_1846_length_9050_cov_10.563991_7_plen_79_part_00
MFAFIEDEAKDFKCERTWMGKSLSIKPEPPKVPFACERELAITASLRWRVCADRRVCVQTLRTQSVHAGKSTPMDLHR